MKTSDIIDILLSMSESMVGEDKIVLEKASEIIKAHNSEKGVCGPFESRVVAIGHTFYAGIGEAVKILDLMPRDEIKVTVEKV